MRTILATLLVTALGTGTAAAWPGMFLFVGYIKNMTVNECQQLMERACTQTLGQCKRSTAGRTLAVGHTGGVYNFSLQCTYFPDLNVVMYGVAGSAEKGRDQDLLPRVKQIKDIIDKRLR